MIPISSCPLAHVIPWGPPECFKGAANENGINGGGRNHRIIGRKRGWKGATVGKAILVYAEQIQLAHKIPKWTPRKGSDYNQVPFKLE